MAFTAAACGSGGGHPPTARLTVAPAYVPFGDAYSTDVTLDASASADAIDDPAGVQPLSFSWTVEDGMATITPNPRAPRVTVRVAGTHPVAVHIEVTDVSGEHGAASAVIGVSLPP
jgi:hypothetical protein